MTLIVLEGASRSGKSTIRDRLVERRPKWVTWKGTNLMREGIGESWIDYRERYHEALHRLYELNPENVILADRGFTDCVYNSDEQIREEFRRLAACYGDAYVLYFFPGDLRWSNQRFDETDSSERHAHLVHESEGRDVLFERGTRDQPKLNRVLNEYEELLSMFPYQHIDTDELDVETATNVAEQAILDWYGTGEHDPDV
jgi:hypothetical protein